MELVLPGGGRASPYEEERGVRYDLPVIQPGNDGPESGEINKVLNRDPGNGAKMPASVSQYILPRSMSRSKPGLAHVGGRRYP